MGKRAMYEEYLAQTERHVALGIGHIAKQLAIVDNLRRGGRDTDEAVRLLHLFEETQVLHENHRNQLRSELKELREQRWKKARPVSQRGYIHKCPQHYQSVLRSPKR